MSDSKSGGSDFIISDTSRTSPKYRPFDVSSLMRKDTSPPSPAPPPRGDNASPSKRSPLASPDVSVGPPSQPAAPSSLYPYLLNTGLYHQLMAGGPPGFPPSSTAAASFPGLNPMLLNAHLALAAQQNPLLATAYANLNASASIGPPSASLMMDRLKQHRFSPYPVPSPFPPLLSPPPSSAVSPPGLSSSASSRSAFQSVVPRGGHAPSPPRSPATPPRLSPPAKTVSPPCHSPARTPPSDIRNIENMVNGLNGSVDGKFGISHHEGSRRSLASQ